jgi:hypothetical protein
MTRVLIYCKRLKDKNYKNVFTFGPPPFTPFKMKYPIIKNRETARTAGLWLPNAEERVPKTIGPRIADDLPTRL